MEKSIFKKVSKAGSVTIPSQLRHLLNIPKGSAIEMKTTDQDEIIIKKHIPTCICCGSADNVKIINKVELCQSCVMKFAGGTEDGNDN